MTNKYRARGMSPEQQEVRAAVREQVEFNKRLYADRVARIVRVAGDNPSLPLWALAERFNEAEDSIRSILDRHGLFRGNHSDDVTHGESRAIEAPEGFMAGARTRGAA